MARAALLASPKLQFLLDEMQDGALSSARKRAIRTERDAISIVVNVIIMIVLC